MKKQALKLHEEINRLTFEAAIAPDDEPVESVETSLRVAESPSDDGRSKIIHLDPHAALEIDQQALEELHVRMSPLQNEINQLNRQFLVSKDQLKANKYDLSASRYRWVEQDEVFHEKPLTTLGRLQELEKAMGRVTRDLLEEV